MNNKVKWIVLAVGLVSLLITAGVLYPKLSQKVDLPDTSNPSGAQNADAAQPENLAADFTVYDASGNAVSLSDLRGKPVIVNFWASWCPPCKAELPYFDEAFQQYGEDIVFLMVDLADGESETQEAAARYVSECGYAFPVYYDIFGSAANAYQLYSIPQTVAVNAAGEQVFSRIGGLTEQTVLELAAQMANGS